MISRGGIRRPMTTGPRPSFQYRDGSFICDLCKKSFSDGNDMVTHWKSHVKQQRANMASGPSRGGSMIRGRGRPSGGGRLPPPSKGPRGRPGRSKGRPGPPPKKGKAAKKGSGKKSKTGKAERSDKGRPRWTAYLLWSTRRYVLHASLVNIKFKKIILLLLYIYINIIIILQEERNNWRK